MEQNYTTRLNQAQQQYQHKISQYGAFSNHPQHLSGPYQLSNQHHQFSDQQNSGARHTRTIVNSLPANKMQYRRSGTANNSGNSNTSGRPNSHPTTIGTGGLTHQQYSGGMNGTVDGHYAVISAGAAMHHPGVMSLQHHRTIASQDMPLRIVVDARYVGAIIGQGGSNIREITRESKARCVVDVQRAMRDPLGTHEKVISIFGQPDSCSKACLKILEVVRREMAKECSLPTHSEIELKMRAHNQLVGRLIGKGGISIKKIMEDTGAVVFVSNEPPMNRDVLSMLPPYVSAPPLLSSDMALQLERTITVKAPDMGIISAAEQRISQKLRQSYQADMSGRMLYSGPSPASVMPFMTPLCGDAGSFLTPAPPPHISRASASNPNSPSAAAFAPPQQRVVRMWVPNNMVGALIGSKGVHIRNVMRMTGAHVRIEGGGGATVNKEVKDKKEKSESKEDAGDSAKTQDVGPNLDDGEIDSAVKLDADVGRAKVDDKKDQDGGLSKTPKISEKDIALHVDERLVTISGDEAQQYKAQFWIYQRVAEQSYHYLDEVRLCTEVGVPSKLVGRIIGKAGQNVRELQRVTGAQVKIPDDAGQGESQETTNVRIIGNFQASQAVQARLGQLVNDFAHRSWSANGASAQGTT